MSATDGAGPAGGGVTPPISGPGGIRNVVARGGTIKVGGIFPLTGGLSALGKPAYQGAQAYFNHLNANGGVQGRKIQFIVCDDQANDTRSTTCGRKLVDQDGVFVMGPSFTPFSLTVIKQFERAGIPWIGYDGINLEGFGARNVVTVGAPIEPMAHALLPHWFDTVARKTGSPPRKLGVFVLDSGPAQTYLKEAREVLCPRLGCTIPRDAVYEVGYTTTAYQAMCRSMQNQNVDAIWIITDPASAIKAFVGCQSAGFQPRKGFLGQHGIFLDLTLRQAGKFSAGTYANSALLPSDVKAPATAEMKRIIRTYYPDAEFGYFTELAYASARLVADTIAKSLTNNPELSRVSTLNAASQMTNYNCNGLCKDVNLSPPASRTGGNHNVWIVRADFSGDEGRWVTEFGPINAYATRTWPCPNQPRPC